MDFGLVLQTDPPASHVISLMQRAERNGFRYGWTFDSAVLWQEPFVIYSQILANTESLTVGPMVTNPGTRTWEVTASTFATLNDMFGNRTVCGIGRGDSAMRVAGRKPNTLARISEAMKVIRALARGEEADLGGTVIRFPWVQPGAELPVWMAAYGPKALKMTGEEADGFILQLADLYLTEYMVKAVKDAAAAAGRDPAKVTICVAAPAYVTADDSPEALAHAREQCRWFGGMVGNHVADLVARYGEHSAAVPDELTDYIKSRQGYDYAHHGRSGNPDTAFVPDEIVDRFCLIGPVEKHIEKLNALRELGVDQFAVYDMHDAQEAVIDAYGREVIPVVNSR
ncbi:TIGR03842 family LLM class F420-dependent oxidoreductase [Streptomyces sp. NPDC006393]|uniref:TIGR03842 family LLM class F420-dependent oxidoreductase n=1 Tax=Streptomyces sp. NPDC006393 TaxID=3156763 RepID=UPI0033FA355A